MLILDTVTGSPAAALYESLGWQTVGTIPGYALNAGRRARGRDLLLQGPAVSDGGWTS